MFPQEFVLALRTNVNISKITTLSLNVKKLCVEKCESDKPDSFEKLFEVELANRGDRLQTEVHQVNIRAKYLRFIMLSGHGEFASMNRVSVVGESAAGEDGGLEGGEEEGARTGLKGTGNSFNRAAYIADDLK
ncbi:uncharacterized protein HaLaN_25175 [Haematococcus lacustris]|uniref:Uncharacterized protein n=1 Tax=Haematococcus lacustris TaxID=44745 RepID=A0A699ZWV0_HAELA|nr:uncharacterized protein HaLaN_25175 [Haematococcus lacustris]